jgi:hypothetical protein
LSKKLIFLSFAFQLSTAIVLGQQVVPANLVPANLVLFPGENPQKVLLPFEYKHLTAEERQKTVWVPQWFYTVINPGSDKLAVVGPVCPCLFIALKNNSNGKIIVFHKHSDNAIQELVELAKKELKIDNPSDIEGKIFTKLFPNEEKHKADHQGRTQLEEVKFIKDFIIGSFNIQNRTQIVANLFTDDDRKFTMSEYGTAKNNIIIGRDFNPCSICMFHENIFSEMEKCSNEPLWRRIDEYNKLLFDRTYKFVDTKLQDSQERNKIKYVLKYVQGTSAYGVFPYFSC